jgi:histidine ammonia-lyase
VPHLQDDRFLAPDIAAAADLVRSGALVAATDAALPEL